MRSLIVMLSVIMIFELISGSMDSCRRRLKSHYRNQAMSKVYKRTVTYHYDMICIVDFEATCDSATNPQPIQEIIEFPAIMVDVKRKQIVFLFDLYFH